MRTRRLPIELRSADGQPEGVLVGYVTTWDSRYPIGRDRYEVIQRNAFDESIARSGGVFPLFFEHDWTNKEVPCGFFTASADDHGLRVDAQLFLDTDKGKSVWLAAQAGALREWSIGFGAEDSGIRYDAATKTEFIEVGDLLEASVCIRGKNPATEMIEVRSGARERGSSLVYGLINAVCSYLDAARYATSDSDVIELVKQADLALDELMEALGIVDDDTETDDQGATMDSLTADQLARIVAHPVLRATYYRTLAGD